MTGVVSSPRLVGHEMGTGYRRYYIFEGLRDELDDLVDWCAHVGIGGCALAHPDGHLVLAMSSVDMRPRPLVAVNPEVALPNLDPDIGRLLGTPGHLEPERIRAGAHDRGGEIYGDHLREAQAFVAFAERHATRLFRYHYSDRSYTCGVVDFEGKRLFDACEDRLIVATPDSREVSEVPPRDDDDDPSWLLEDYTQEELDAYEELDHEAVEDSPSSIEEWDELCKELLRHYARPILPHTDEGLYGGLSALIDPDYFWDDYHDVDESELDDDYVYPDLWREVEVEPLRCEDCSGSGLRRRHHGPRHSNHIIYCGGCSGTGLPGRTIDRYRASLEALNSALDRLDAVLARDRTISDADFLAHVRDHNEHLAETNTVTVLPSHEPLELGPLIRDFELAFNEPLALDLRALLNRWNGIEACAAGRKPAFSDSCFLPAAQIIEHRSIMLDWEAPFRAVPFAISWPGGPLLALMIDDSGGPYRVVTLDCETADELEVQVVAEHLGDAVTLFVDRGLAVLDTTQRTVDTIIVPKPEPPPEPEPTLDDSDAVTASAASAGERPLPPIVKEKPGLTTGPPPESIRYWESLVMCVLGPGLAHMVTGQMAKGLLIIGVVICTCGLGWLLAPLYAYDLHKVRRAQTQRDVGRWEFFPELDHDL